MRILHIVGARPNFMKVAPVMRALARLRNIEQTLVHTGQHYDSNMSGIFFEQLQIPVPDINLCVGSGSHAAQTAQIMIRLEEVVTRAHPDRVLVYGDVNSTVAAAFVCAKLGIAVDHIEAGLRSYDRSMPEEINRLVTDRLCNLLFTPSEDATENLLHEGCDAMSIHLVGNLMIDTVVHLLPQAESIWEQVFSNRFQDSKYLLATIHRPANVDDPQTLTQLISTLGKVARQIPVIFPVHPRTRVCLEGKLLTESLASQAAQLVMVEPLGYLEFLALQRHALAVITDSGGVQEETTYLCVPCLTLRANTERPVTVTHGTNTLVGRDMHQLELEISRVLSGSPKQGIIPPLWDGNSGTRIAEVLSRLN